MTQTDDQQLEIEFNAVKDFLLALGDEKTINHHYPSASRIL